MHAFIIQDAESMLLTGVSCSTKSKRLYLAPQFQLFRSHDYPGIPIVKRSWSSVKGKRLKRRSAPLGLSEGLGDEAR